MITNTILITSGTEQNYYNIIDFVPHVVQYIIIYRLLKLKSRKTLIMDLRPTSSYPPDNITLDVQ